MNGPTSITATVPAAGSAGKIAVKAGSTTATSSAAFLLLPTISSISPTSAAVGANVVITGTGFVHATHVGFNGFKPTTRWYRRPRSMPPCRPPPRAGRSG